jgi:hyperosmotically inducible periplasmic protein
MRGTVGLARLLLTLILSLVFAAGAAAQAPRPSDAQLEDEIRAAIMRLPYYGVFDLIAFEVRGGAVTLAGAVSQAVLKAEAEKAVKKIPGVTQVVNKVEILPVSIDDDRIRWAVFRAIYTDSFLSRYGTPIAGLAGGHSSGMRYWGSNFGSWHGFREGRWGRTPFLGMEPVGNYAIHIIVKNGVVSLFGTVSNPVDRTKAELDARSVFGVRSVENELQVSPG